MSVAFDINMGVNQGCPAIPCVFSLFLDRVWNFIMIHIPSSQYVQAPLLALLVIFILLYADHLVLITDSSERFQ